MYAFRDARTRMSVTRARVQRPTETVYYTCAESVAFSAVRHVVVEPRAWSDVTPWSMVVCVKARTTIDVVIVHPSILDFGFRFLLKLWDVGVLTELRPEAELRPDPELTRPSNRFAPPL